MDISLKIIGAKNKNQVHRFIKDFLSLGSKPTCIIPIFDTDTDTDSDPDFDLDYPNRQPGYGNR